jgi:mono/diheme cytochrome c family protein
MAHRAFILCTVIAAAVGLAACGRASEEEIYQALGITPTPTQSAEQIAQATAAASATAEAREIALATPGAASVAFLGDVTKGKMTFSMWCIACHGPGAAGGEIADLDGYTPDSFMTFIRTGEGHPPGPYQAFQITDTAVMDLGTYLSEGSK